MESPWERNAGVIGPRTKILLGIATAITLIVLYAHFPEQAVSPPHGIPQKQLPACVPTTNRRHPSAAHPLPNSPRDDAPALEKEVYDLTVSAVRRFTEPVASCHQPRFYGHNDRQPQLSQSARIDGQWLLCEPLDGGCTAVTGGIKDDWSFEEELSHVCTGGIYGHDHTIKTPNVSLPFSLVSRAIGGINNQTMSTIDAILDEHQIDVLDVLKLDIERSEEEAIAQMAATHTLRDRVKQFTWELHLDTFFLKEDFDRYACRRGRFERCRIHLMRLHALLDHLDSEGFLLVDWHQNPRCWHCKELLSVNKRYAGQLLESKCD